MTIYTKQVNELERFFLEDIFVIMFYLIKKNINHSELKLLTTLNQYQQTVKWFKIANILENCIVYRYLSIIIILY